jgi:3-isopropylmalate/(R)-2-methylmalate dehydratase small subunit
MKPIRIVAGTLAPLPRNNVDTDQIMPKNFLKRVERAGYGEFVFYDWARLPGGDLNPDFVLNKPEYQNAKILVSGPNFGSGSSREHAPWGIQDWGFDAVIAPSFADIFYNNCTKIGLLPVPLSEKEVQWLLELGSQEPEAVVTIDLPDQTVSTEGFEATFEIDPFIKHRLLNGLDDIALTMQHEADISAFEATRPSYRPVLGA